MRLLLLGGPRFSAAPSRTPHSRGHELTFFNRGTTNPELYPEVERIVGDERRPRRAARSTLGRRRRHVRLSPGAVRASADALALGPYCFVSSISVYADFSSPNDEDSPVAELGDLSEDEMTTRATAR